MDSGYDVNGNGAEQATMTSTKHTPTRPGFGKGETISCSCGWRFTNALHSVREEAWQDHKQRTCEHVWVSASEVHGPHSHTSTWCSKCDISEFWWRKLKEQTNAAS